MKNIFISERDHLKWIKQKDYINHLDSIDEATKTKAIKALDFLEQELGAKFLKTTSINHPIRQMISNKTSYQIKDLIEFADTLNFLKTTNSNYNKLLRKLLSQKDAIREGIPFVEVARTYIKEGLNIFFIDEDKNRKTPDLQVMNNNTGEKFYIEITKLSIRDESNQITENYDFFHKQFNDVLPSFPFYGNQKKKIEQSEYPLIAKIIADTKLKVKENNQIIYYSDNRFSFLLAPNRIKDFNEICEQNNIEPIRFNGLTHNFDETSRINNKISKVKQIPEKSNGLLYIEVSILYFMSDLSVAVERLEANIAEHKNLLGIVLFSKIVAPIEETTIKKGNHFFAIRAIENLCYTSLFIYNNNCEVFVSDEMLKKIYKSLT